MQQSDLIHKAAVCAKETAHVVSPQRRAWCLQMVAGAMAPFALAKPALTQGVSTPWPAQPLRLVVPCARGSGIDVFARPLATQLGWQLERLVMIDNRADAGGSLAAWVAAQSPADGYTYFLGATHELIAPGFYPKLAYQPDQNLVPITSIARAPQVLVVNPTRVAAPDIHAFIKFAHAHEGTLTYGTTGVGTSQHFAAEWFKYLTKTSLVHKAYRGFNGVLARLLSGQIDMMFDSLTMMAPHIRSGALRPLLVASDKRVPAFKHIPTSVEMGLPHYRMATTYGIWGVAGSNPEIHKRLYREIDNALYVKALRVLMEDHGAEPIALAPVQFARLSKRRVQRWRQINTALGTWPKK